MEHRAARIQTKSWLKKNEQTKYIGGIIVPHADYFQLVRSININIYKVRRSDRYNSDLYWNMSYDYFIQMKTRFVEKRTEI